MTGGKVGAVAGELSSRLAHPAWPTGGAAVLALIAAVGILVLAPAADAQSPCMPWEIYRPSLRMCEAMTDTSAAGGALESRCAQTGPHVALSAGAGRSESSRARTTAQAAFCGEAEASESSPARTREGSGTREGGGP